MLQQNLCFSVVFFLLCGVICSSPAWATSGEKGEEKRFGFGLSIGYGEGVAVRSVQKMTNVGDVEWMAIEPWIRMRLTDLGDGTHWYDGTLNAFSWGP